MRLIYKHIIVKKLNFLFLRYQIIKNNMTGNFKIECQSLLLNYELSFKYIDNIYYKTYVNLYMTKYNFKLYLNAGCCKNIHNLVLLHEINLANFHNCNNLNNVSVYNCINTLYISHCNNITQTNNLSSIDKCVILKCKNIKNINLSLTRTILIYGNTKINDVSLLSLVTHFQSRLLKKIYGIHLLKNIEKINISVSTNNDYQYNKLKKYKIKISKMMTMYN